MLYRRRNTPAKKRILLFLRIVATIIKIKAETTIKITEIATKVTKTLAVIKYTDTLIVIADLRDVAISIRKRIAAYRDI